MLYDGNGYAGMHFMWWFVWLSLLFWIFATPYDIPGQRMKNKSPLDILKGRFASGEINSEEYSDRKKILESN